MEKKHQELQDQDQLGSPHLEEEDWWKCRSRSPLTFPPRYSRIMGGIERQASFSKGQQWRRERGKTCSKAQGTVGEEGPLNRSPEIQPLCSDFASPAWGRPWARPGLGRPKNCINTQYENGHILIIRTPFLMFLVSLESQRRALQDHAQNHHSPTWKDKTKCRKVNLLYKRTTGKSSNIKTQQDNHQDSVFYDLGLVPKIITSPTRSCIYTSQSIM